MVSLFLYPIHNQSVNTQCIIIIMVDLGLDKLQITSEEVKVLQANLEVMKPALEIAAKDADVMIKLIAADTVLAFQ